MTVRELITSVNIYDNIDFAVEDKSAYAGYSHKYKIIRNSNLITEDMIPAELIDKDIVYICGSKDRYKMMILLKED